MSSVHSFGLSSFIYALFLDKVCYFDVIDVVEFLAASESLCWCLFFHDGKVVLLLGNGRYRPMPELFPGAGQRLVG